MKPETREFLAKLAALMQEYNANIELEGDSYYDGELMILELKNPQTFDEHYDQWVVENPDKQYPFDESGLYSYAEWIDLKGRFDAESLKELLK